MARRRSPFGKRRSVLGMPRSAIAPTPGAPCVLGVQDREVRPVAEELGVGAQEPVADRVERPARDPRECRP